MRTFETLYEYHISKYDHYGDLNTNTYDKKSINDTIAFIKDKFCIPFFISIDDLPNWKTKHLYLKQDGSYIRL